MDHERTRRDEGEVACFGSVVDILYSVAAYDGLAKLGLLEDTLVATLRITSDFQPSNPCCDYGESQNMVKFASAGLDHLDPTKRSRVGTYITVLLVLPSSRASSSRPT